MPESTENNGFAGTSLRLKIGLAEMLKGGVIMDVMSVEQARIAEESGATSVMALERVPAMIRAEGGVARMARPSLIKQIIQAVSIPVMAKARIGHTAGHKSCKSWVSTTSTKAKCSRPPTRRITSTSTPSRLPSSAERATWARPSAASPKALP